MRYPPDRHLDNRWNLALDRLIAAWNEAGPDDVLAALSALAAGYKREAAEADEIAATREAG